MFTTSAFAQAMGPSGAGDIVGFIAPLVLIMGVFYFLLIRPQQKKQKDHQASLSKISRGDTIVTHGGLIGKVTKLVDDHELQVEVGEGVKVRVLRAGVAEIRSRGEPAK